MTLNWAPYEPATGCVSYGPQGCQALLVYTEDVFAELHRSLGICNCLAYETPVVTRDGWVPIGDLAGTDTELLTYDGKSTARWVKAPIRSFGTQQLWRIKVSRRGRVRELYATREHRWFVHEGYGGALLKEATTQELKPGQKLESVYPQSVASRARTSPVGIQAGLVFGDGTANSHDSRIMLHGPKNLALSEWFSNQQPRIIYDDSALITALPRSFKALPSLDEGPSFLYGWLAGYFAADGRVDLKGNPNLYSAEREHLEFVRLLALRLGIVTGEVIGRKRQGYGDEPTMLYELWLDPRKLDSSFFLIPSHRERWNERSQRLARWKVESVEPTDRIEEVFCAVVKDTENFVVDEFILTGNCRATVGGTSWSHHAECRALDMGFVSIVGRTFAYDYAVILGEHGSRVGIDHIITNRKPWAADRGVPVIFSARSPEGRVYTGAHPHKDHNHTGLTRNAGRRLTYATLVAVYGRPEAVARRLLLHEIGDEDVKEVYARLQASLIRAGYDLGAFPPYLPAGDPDSLPGADGDWGPASRAAQDAANRASAAPAHADSDHRSLATKAQVTQVSDNLAAHTADARTATPHS